jgi:hypothetical protein
MFDAMGTTFDEVRTWRDPACPACGDAARVAIETDSLQPAQPASVAGA